MPLSFEQFKQLRDKGLSNDQIVKFEGGYTPPQPTTQQPEQPKGILEKTLGGTSDFLMGSLNRVIGTGILKGASKLEQLTRPESLQTGVDPALQQQLEQRGQNTRLAELQQLGEKTKGEMLTPPSLTKGDILFGALESPYMPTKLAKPLLKPLAKVGEALKESAVKSVTKVLAPTKEKFKAITEKIAPELVERGFIGNKEKLLQKAKQATSSIGEKIGNAFDALPDTSKLEVAPIVNGLEELKYSKNYIVKEAGKDITVNPQAVNDINKIQEVFVQFGKDASDKNLRKIRQMYDSVVSKKGGFVKTDLSLFSDEAKREASNVIRDELAKRHPDIAVLNKEFTFWKNVENVTKETLKRKTGQQEMIKEVLIPNIGTGVGAVIGASGGVAGGVGGALIGREAVKQLQKFVTSDIWRTFSAQGKNKIGQLLIEGKEKELINLLSRITIATGAKAQE